MESSNVSGNWEGYFSGVKKSIFYTIAIVSFAGNLVDIFSFDIDPTGFVFYCNLSNAGIVVLAVGLYIARKLPLNIGNAIIIYALIFNILLSQFMGMENPRFESFFLRETIFVGILITATGFVLRKTHVLIIGSIYLAFYLTVLFLSGNEFLKQNAILLTLAIVTYTAWIYYLMHLLKRGYEKQAVLIAELNRQNKELDEKRNNLRKLNETKDKFFSIVAHDLKNPFNTLLGYSNLLKNQIKRREFHEAERSGDEIHETSRRGYNLLTNLLDWSRSQTGRMEFTPIRFSPGEILEGILELYASGITKKQIRIKSEIEPELSIQADQNMIQTIMRNLISNAIKFTEPGGEIIIGLKREDQVMHFRVSDTGIGISKENMEKLFRLDSDFSRPGTEGEKGTGLGLILCKEFVDKHKGKIWLESEPGRGTTFHVSLPDT